MDRDTETADREGASEPPDANARPAPSRPSPTDDLVVIPFVPPGRTDSATARPRPAAVPSAVGRPRLDPPTDLLTAPTAPPADLPPPPPFAPPAPSPPVFTPAPAYAPVRVFEPPPEDPVPHPAPPIFPPPRADDRAPEPVTVDDRAPTPPEPVAAAPPSVVPDATIEVDPVAAEREDAPPARRRRRIGVAWPTLRRGHEPAAESPNGGSALAGLEAREISAWFGNNHVLDRVSLNMAPGRVTALIGPSGCGKSTFLRILNRMHELIPSASLAGEVLLDGHDIYDPKRKLTDARRQVGMVFQKPNPFPAMSIYDNVLAGLKLTGTHADQGARDDLVEESLIKAGLWREVRDRLRDPGAGLSGGQQQRLCIARALAIKPRVLLMDEPCSALDPTSTRRVEETIIEIVSEVTIVIVTHNMQQASRVSDECAFFLAELGTPGVIVEHGPTDAMFGAPQDQRTADYVAGRFG